MPGVGANLEDHISFGVMFDVLAADALTRIMNPLIALWQMILFILFKVGLFSSMSVKRCIWVRSGAIDDATMKFKPYGDEHGELHDNMDAMKPENIPDIEYLLVPASTTDGSLVENGRHANSLLCTLVQAHSRGRVELASADPLAMPRWYHPFFADPRDRLVARKAARFAMHYVERFWEKDYPYKSVWFRAPGVKSGTTEGTWEDPTDEEIDAYVNKLTRSTFHPTSTCRMVPEEDGGVVDQSLKVYGFKNLRIADASIFPKITSAHTMAPVLMIAERCADFIKRDWNMKA